ncbi:DNA polymerase [Caudoviricetes sp.]|nr:DNA polymerase [Caudoviricetes sp.]
MLGPLTAHVSGFVQQTLTTGVAPRPKVRVNPDIKALRYILLLCRKYKQPLSVDVETGKYGNLSRYAHLRAVGVGVDRGIGEACSWKWPMPYRVMFELGDALKDPSLPKLFVNGWSYDIPILRRYGFKVKGPVHDIRDGRHALDSESRVGLAPQAAMYLPGCQPWKREAVADEDEKGHVDDSTPLEKLLPYNGFDCVYAAQIRSKQRREIRDDARVGRIYRQQLRLAEVAGEMHYKGLFFDCDAQIRLRAELTATFKQRRSELMKLLRPRGGVAVRISDTGGVNENDLKALLFRECAKKGIRSFGLEVPLSKKSWTDGDQPSVNKDALLILMSQRGVPREAKDIIRACWHVDAPLKLLSTYINSKKVEDAIGPDGFIHPKVSSVGTATYRWACKAPNLFNLPEQKDEDTSVRGDLPNVRELYRAPPPGWGGVPEWVVVHRDWKGLELEVMAEYTGDAKLRIGLDGGDLHTARCRDWFKIAEPEPVPKQVRHQTKIVGFLSQYGGGDEMVFAKMLEQVPDAVFEECRALWLMFREGHTGIVEHWTRTLEQAHTLGYNEAPIMGYRRYYAPGAQIVVTDTSNYPIQGGAAAIANSTMVGIDSWKGSMIAALRKQHPKAWLALHTYDSFDVICPAKEAKAVDALMDHHMRGPWRIGAQPRQYLSDGKIGHRLSEV